MFSTSFYKYSFIFRNINVKNQNRLFGLFATRICVFWFLTSACIILLRYVCCKRSRDLIKVWISSKIYTRDMNSFKFCLNIFVFNTGGSAKYATQNKAEGSNSFLKGEAVSKLSCSNFKHIQLSKDERNQFLSLFICSFVDNYLCEWLFCRFWCLTFLVKWDMNTDIWLAWQKMDVI